MGDSAWTAQSDAWQHRTAKTHGKLNRAVLRQFFTKFRDGAKIDKDAMSRMSIQSLMKEWREVKTFITKNALRQMAKKSQSRHDELMDMWRSANNSRTVTLNELNHVLTTLAEINTDLEHVLAFLTQENPASRKP